MAVRRRDGIHIEIPASGAAGESGGATGERSGRTFVADASSAVGDVNVVSHAHADHTFRRTPETVVCSAATAALVEARTGASLPAFREGTDEVTLYPSGHVVGSRAALVEADGADRPDGATRRYLYTGDFSVRDRLYLEGFDPVDADVLVMETTYGKSKYRFPPEDELQAGIRDWLADAPDRPLFLFGYSLGRAQKLQRLARQATDRRLVVHDAIRTVNDAIEAATDLSFPAESLSADGGDEVVVLPTHLSRTDWVTDLVERHDALKAGFSGWAVDRSFRYRGGYDVTFPLTDHCDFDELVATVRAVDPEVVYTHHGFDEAFADHLATHHGYDARPLLGDQTRLDDF
ncbi:MULTISPECIES: mRNA cleavage and polyadenylation specificity factor-like protein [Halorussus]|uniref:mRNA cleavage and polyadenylation specificity factor-like protein n=1 Tax=Halorussus TaxID=1070314 RepID=UPI000E20F4E4|nr:MULTISPECIES: mRNA cleavage and polyadenylation specificity factor-like protein [Halorussus]NHN61360.1 mRNA cleavage and polyadenylation specificity factor-like protein [Halorussus sp. JP-T4]